jgi:hypothetical protein
MHLLDVKKEKGKELADRLAGVTDSQGVILDASRFDTSAEAPAREHPSLALRAALKLSHLPDYLFRAGRPFSSVLGAA